MMNSETFKVATPSDLEIAMTRVFNAPPRLVFDALTKPELVKQWLLGPPGWSMPVCEIDLRVGGAYRYVWRNAAKGKEMGSGGVFREIVLHERIVCTELFDDTWYAGEALATNVLTEQGGKTTLILTVLYQLRETRDAVGRLPRELGLPVDRVVGSAGVPRRAAGRERHPHRVRAVGCGELAVVGIDRDLLQIAGLDQFF